MATIPEIRERMHAMSRELRKLGKELEHLADATKRRKIAGRGPRSSVPVTPAIKRSVRKMRKDFPRRSLTDIAKHHKIKSGRVTEILFGYRK